MGETTEFAIGISNGGRKNMPVMVTKIRKGIKIQPSLLCHFRFRFRAATSWLFSFCLFRRFFSHFGKIKCISPVIEMIRITRPNKSTTSFPMSPQISPLCSNHRVLKKLASFLYPTGSGMAISWNVLPSADFSNNERVWTSSSDFFRIRSVIRSSSTGSVIFCHFLLSANAYPTFPLVPTVFCLGQCPPVWQ